MSARSKPFQAATVKAATVALSGGNPLRRFLVADEVGLGKTVVARDTLAALASKARVVSRMWWKLPSSGLRACNVGSGQAARSRDIGSSG